MRPWRSPISWGLVLVFTGTSSNTFAMFAWSPPYLTDQGLSDADAGFALFLYSITGLPVSFVVPLLVVRMHNPLPLGLFLAGCAAAGYAGLLVSPRDGTLLWALLAALGAGVLLAGRSRTLEDDVRARPHGPGAGCR